MLAFVVHAAAVVVAVTGVGKLVDPTAVSAALERAGLVSGPWVGRGLGAVEVAVGGWVLAAGGRPSSIALALLYGGFLAFIVANRVRGLEVPCGCVGRSTKPPGAAHVVVDVVAAAAAVAAAIGPVGAAAGWLDEGGAGVAALVGVAAVGVGVVVGLEAAGRDGRGGLTVESRS